MRLVRSYSFRTLLIIAAGWTCWEAPQAIAATDQDFDLACAVVSAAEIATTAVGSAERNTAFQIQFFYLGRLSGRDDRTYWAAVVKGRLAELKTKLKHQIFMAHALSLLPKRSNNRVIGRPGDLAT